MAGELITADFQLEFRGVLLGDGSDRELVSFEGLSLPDLRTGDTDRPLDHGQFSGQDYLSGRRFVTQLEVWGTSEAEHYAAYSAVLDATTPGADEEVLVFRLPEWPDDLYVLARPRRRAGPVVNERFNFLVAEITVEWWATDPRIYSATERTQSVALGGATAGLAFPATFDLTFGGVGTSNVIHATNSGNFESRPLGRIDGPVTNPRLENQTTGQTLALNGTLAAGEWLDVDFLNRTVLLNGTASRYAWVADPDGWWVLEPGLNDVRFTGTGAGTFTLYWRSAWI